VLTTGTLTIGVFAEETPTAGARMRAAEALTLVAGMLTTEALITELLIIEPLIAELLIIELPIAELFIIEVPAPSTLGPEPTIAKEVTNEELLITEKGLSTEEFFTSSSGSPLTSSCRLRFIKRKLSLTLIWSRGLKRVCQC